MHPILTRYGSFFLYSFTVVMIVGIAAGLGITAWRTRRSMMNKTSDWLDTFLAALVIGSIGGRAGFVWLEWGYFQERPYEILQIWRGGLTYHGALLAGLLGGWAWCVWRKRSFLRDADLMAPSLALVSAFGWLACWLDGCGYGREAPAGAFLAASLPDNLGIVAWRYQTQLLGAGLSLLVFALALVGARRWPGGQFYFVLFALSLGRAGLGFWRGDTAVLIGAIRIDTLLDTALALLSLILLQYSHMKKTKSSIINRQSYET